MPQKEHICNFERLPIDFTPTFFSSGVISAERFITAIELLFKRQEKSKRVRRCRTCGQYAIECPYCKQTITSFDYPLKMTCPHCDNEFQVRWE